MTLKNTVMNKEHSVKIKTVTGRYYKRCKCEKRRKTSLWLGNTILSKMHKENT